MHTEFYRQRKILIFYLKLSVAINFSEMRYLGMPRKDHLSNKELFRGLFCLAQSPCNYKIEWNILAETLTTKEETLQAWGLFSGAGYPKP